MIDDKYFACVITKEEGLFYAGAQITLVKHKENALRFIDHFKAVCAYRKLREIAERQGLTVMSASTLIDYENRAAQSQKAKPQKIEPDGVEAIDVIDQAVADPASFYRGNALKHLLRAGKKGDARQDLEKARYYIDRELGNE
ncbi:DUF3310 domain-containing protein [Corynebacterium propinquum]